MPSLINDPKAKVIIHKRITKTFVANTPTEQSVDRSSNRQQPIRQRDKLP